LLALQGFNAGDIPPHDANARRVRQLSGGELKPQFEHFFVELA